MANTLTSLVPTMYEALDIVSREMVGFIPAVTQNFSAERAALNQSILIPITPMPTLAPNTPAVTAPDTGDQNIANTEMKITASNHAPIRWNGEEQRGMLNAGTYMAVLRGQFANAVRVHVNAIEVALFDVIRKTSSRAYGTAGTAPFGTASDLSDIANLRRILDDNGAPQGDLQFVMGAAAVANLRGKQTILLRANESGSTALLRQGSISAEPLDGFSLHNSNAVQTVTKGTGASYVTSGSTAVNGTSIALVTGTGTVNAGDFVTFAADTNNKYVVNTGVAAAGTIVIGAPGARAVIGTANAMTVGADHTPSLGFSKSAVQLITRAPAMPVGPDGRAMDAGEDSVMLTDPVSGLTFEVTLYRQYRQMVFHVALAYGVAAIKPNHIATLLG